MDNQDQPGANLKKDYEKYEVDPNWDSFPNPTNLNPYKKSFFSGKKSLVNQLSHWIVNSNGGSVLVSGVRGIGKTAFTYYSIQEANRNLKSANVWKTYVWRLSYWFKSIAFGLWNFCKWNFCKWNFCERFPQWFGGTRFGKWISGKLSGKTKEPLRISWSFVKFSYRVTKNLLSWLISLTKNLLNWLLYKSGVPIRWPAAFFIYVFTKLEGLLLRKQDRIIFVPINAARLLTETHTICRKGFFGYYAVNNSLEENGWTLLKEIITELLLTTNSRAGKLLDIYHQTIGKGQQEIFNERKHKYALNISLPIVALISFLTLILLEISSGPSSAFHIDITKIVIGPISVGNFFATIIWLSNNPTLKVSLAAVSGIATLATILINLESSKRITRNIKIDNDNAVHLYTNFNQFLNDSDSIYVFVIDEIDKFLDSQQIKDSGKVTQGNKQVETGGSLQVESSKIVSTADEESFEKLNDLIQKLKNLFTISSGRFIFITHEKYSYLLSRVRDPEGDFRPKSSTYFNWQIFLPLATPDDIMNYIKAITGDKIRDESAEFLAYYLYAKAGGAFSEVKQELRNFIRFDNRTKKLILESSKVTDLEKKFARLGRICFMVYEDGLRDVNQPIAFNFIKGDLLHAVFTYLLAGGIVMEVAAQNLFDKFKGRANYDILSDEQIKVLVDSFRTLLNDFRIKAGTKVQAYEPFNDNTTTGKFDIQMDTVPPDFRGLGTKRSGLNATQKQFVEKCDKLLPQMNELISEIQTDLGLETKQEVLNLKSFVTDYSNINDSYESLKGYTENDVVESNDDLTLLDAKAKKLEEIVKELNPKSVKESFIHKLYSEKLTFLDNKKTQELIPLPQIASETLESTLAIQAVSDSTTNLKTFIFSKKQNWPNPRQETNSATENKKIEVIETNVKPTDMSITKLIAQIDSNLSLVTKLTKSNDWVARPKPTKQGQQFDVRPITNVIPGRFEKLSFEVSSESPRWRAGLFFGCKTPDDIPNELSNESKRLIHIYKDEDSDDLKYKRFGMAITDQPTMKGKVIIEKANFTNIKVEVARDKQKPGMLVVSVNGQEIDRFSVGSTNIENIQQLAWADANNDFQLIYRNIKTTVKTIPTQTSKSNPLHDKKRIKVVTSIKKQHKKVSLRISRKNWTQTKKEV